jgi:hypothetical protein
MPVVPFVARMPASAHLCTRRRDSSPRACARQPPPSTPAPPPQPPPPYLLHPTRRFPGASPRTWPSRPGVGLPPPRKVQPGIPRAVPCLPCCHAALPAPHIRSCSGSRLCVLHRLHSTSRSTQKLESHNRHWKSHQPKPAAGNGGGSGVSIGVVVSAAGGSGRLSCAPARCQMCTDLARARVGAHAAPDLEHRSPRSCRPGSRSS